MTRPTDRPDLAVGICTRNNIRTIERTIRSVKDLARTILVVDSGSNDGTVRRCEELGAEVVFNEWPGYAKQKQFVLDALKKHRWILLLDSDESLEPSLCESVRAMLADDDASFDGWEMNRKVWFLGAWLEHCFQPEWRLRLVRGGKGRVTSAGNDDAQVHETIHVPGEVARLRGDLRHDSWTDLEDMFRRSITYARLSAAGGGRGGSILRILISPPAAFCKQYLIRGGLLDGARGLLASGGVAVGTFMKHLFIAQRRAGLMADSDKRERA